MSADERRLRAEHRWRQLQHEPRLSVADERTMTNVVRTRERREAQTEVRRRLATIRRELDALSVKLGVAAAGGHRDTLRMIGRGIDALERSVPRDQGTVS